MAPVAYLTTTITVWDRDRRAVDEKTKAVERVINGRGFVTILETLNAIDAWLGSAQPGPLPYRSELAHLFLALMVEVMVKASVQLDAPDCLSGRHAQRR